MPSPNNNSGIIILPNCTDLYLNFTYFSGAIRQPPGKDGAPFHILIYSHCEIFGFPSAHLDLPMVPVPYFLVMEIPRSIDNLCCCQSRACIGRLGPRDTPCRGQCNQGRIPLCWLYHGSPPPPAARGPSINTSYHAVLTF